MTCATCTVRSEYNALSRRLGHDLRAPLRALTNIPTWIREDLEAANVSLPSDIVEHFDMIETQSHQMEQIIYGLVEFVAAASGENKFEIVDAEGEITRLLGDVASDRKYTVSIASEVKELCLPRADFIVLFGHLISNAVRHCSDSASLCVRGSRQGPLALFEVEDNGPGIAEPDQNRIFEPFEMLQSSGHSAGCGLGLATARKIAASWNGSISVTDADPNGSIFELRFPAVQTAPSEN